MRRRKTDRICADRFGYDKPVDLRAATTKEAAQTKWLKKPAIKELFDRGDLVHTLGYFFGLEGI